MALAIRRGPDRSGRDLAGILSDIESVAKSAARSQNRAVLASVCLSIDTALGVIEYVMGVQSRDRLQSTTVFRRSLRAISERGDGDEPTHVERNNMERADAILSDARMLKGNGYAPDVNPMTACYHANVQHKRLVKALNSVELRH